MTRTEREQLIERYLGGRLTPAEEQEFFIEVATDREMQYDLKASRVVESAIRKDREKAPDSWSGVRGDLAAMLAAQKGVPANSESEPLPTTRFPIFRGGSGWIVTAAVLFAVAFTSLLISLIAIDRTSIERTARPSVAEPPVRVEESTGVERGEEEGIRALQQRASEEETVERPGRTVQEEVRADRPGRSRGTDQALQGRGRPEDAGEMTSPPVHPETPRVDTINPNGGMPFDVEVPVNKN